MPLPTRFARGTARATARRKSSLTLAVLATAWLAELAGGIVCLVLRFRDRQFGPLLAPAGLMLVACAVVQLRLIFSAWRAGRLSGSENPLASLRFWRSLLMGALVAYLAALAIGPVRNVGCAWIAAVCAWQTLLMLPLAASPTIAEDWRKWTQGRTARRLAWLVYASILILIAGEVGLRAHRLVLDGPAFSAAAEFKQIDSFSSVLQVSEPLAVRVARLKPARFRVAIFGDGAICGRESNGYLVRVEQAVPGVEVVPLAVRFTESGARSVELSAQVHDCDPDLVLAVLPVCQDLARQPAECGYFDWRQFELATLLAGQPLLEESPTMHVSADNFESFLRGLGPQLAACRTPIDDRMRARWDRVFESLDRLIVGCRDARVPVALVIVPAEFQVNRVLRETLLRRNGLPADRFDVELPQRRLARFAEHRDLPLIDLLPHLRLCSQSIYQRHATALNDEGNMAAASAIGGWLQSRYGGQLAAQLSSAP